VANAVLDGVDCIMLGAETLRGKHPVATVETILHICKQAEKVFDHNYHFETLMRVSPAPPLPLLSPSRQSSYTFSVELHFLSVEAFRRHSDEEPSIIPGCPGVCGTHQECQSNMTGNQRTQSTQCSKCIWQQSTKCSGQGGCQHTHCPCVCMYTQAGRGS